MKELIYKKGFFVKVVSWENDADNYNTKEYSVDTLEYAQALKRMCTTLFVPYHRTNRGIANDCDSLYKYKDRISGFMLEDEFFKKMYSTEDPEDLTDIVSEHAYELMGGSQCYSCRVCESCTIYEVEEDVYLIKREIL